MRVFLYRLVSWWLFALVLAAVFISALPVMIAWATGGYPFAHYNGPGSNPLTSVWVGPDGRKYSDLRYYYRNCTDYTAWKLISLGANRGQVMGLSHGGKWASNGRHKGLSVSTTPKVWSAAVQPPSRSNQWGHVAFVEEVRKDGTIKVGEYNYRIRGGYSIREGTPAALGFSEFVSFGIAPPSSSPLALPPPSLLTVKKTKAPDGVPQVYSATKDSVFETWWRSSTGVSTTQLVRLSGIKDIDKHTMPDNAQLLYTVANDAIYETWWRPGSGPHTAKIISLPGIRKVVATNEGTTHLLYGIASDGLYEFWWRDGGDGIHQRRLAAISEPIALAVARGPSGESQVYTATASRVYETWWFRGQSPATTPLIHISQGNITDVAKDMAGGTQFLYTATTAGVWETWWRDGRIGAGHIVKFDGTRRIKKRQWGNTQQLFVASATEVREYAWVPGQPIYCHRRMAGSAITSLDASAEGGVQQLYVSAGNKLLETWWDPRGTFTSALFTL